MRAPEAEVRGSNPLGRAIRHLLRQLDAVPHRATIYPCSCSISGEFVENGSNSAAQLCPETPRIWARARLPACQSAPVRPGRDIGRLPLQWV